MSVVCPTWLQSHFLKLSHVQQKMDASLKMMFSQSTIVHATLLIHNNVMSMCIRFSFMESSLLLSCVLINIINKTIDLWRYIKMISGLMEAKK